MIKPDQRCPLTLAWHFTEEEEVVVEIFRIIKYRSNDHSIQVRVPK